MTAIKPVNPRRVRAVNHGEKRTGPVVYWMHRDMRLRDNWGLLYARELAQAQGAPLAVLFCLAPRFLDATIRQYGFLLRGLHELAGDATRLRLPFFLRLSDDIPAEVLRFTRQNGVGALVTDFDPLRVKRSWVETVGREAGCGVLEVDSRNIVPCWVTSDKQEYAARTIRPKIHRLLPEFLEEYPEFDPLDAEWTGEKPGTDFDAAWQHLKVDESVPEVDWLQPGETAARAMLDDFIDNRLTTYAEIRNDPTKNGQSNLSPYLHFGQLSAQRAALEVSRSRRKQESRDAFLEELIVRRELSDNFCYYNQQYDSPTSFAGWAATTLAEHEDDLREYVYTEAELETAQTHDPLWNAAQMEMVHRGKMHGYMRMYWAKKILEWTNTTEHAMRVAIRLNDKYQLDGRDSNGYTGVAWSIGGVHDRAWKERPIFGKIRFMSFGGARSKFDVKAYIQINSF